MILAPRHRDHRRTSDRPTERDMGSTSTAPDISTDSARALRTFGTIGFDLYEQWARFEESRRWECTP